MANRLEVVKVHLKVGIWMLSETPPGCGIEAKADNWQLAGILIVDYAFDFRIEKRSVRGCGAIRS